MKRLMIAALALAFSGEAVAQQFGGSNRGMGGGLAPGSTAQGDILRGEGVFLMGAGYYNLNTAMANSINTDTWIRLNEYIYQSIKLENHEKALHRAAVIAERRENYEKILERNRNAPEDEKFKKKDVIVGVLLEGKFKSLYANRLPANIIDTLVHYGTPFQTSSITDNKMIIVSDGDIVLNGTFKAQPLPMGVNVYTMGTQYQYPFANRDFLQNCLDYLINSSGLAQAKSKDYTLRLLDPKKIREEKTKWQIINTVLPVLLVFIFGFIYQYWRRKKYSV